MPKSFVLSRTVWFNIIMGLISSVELILHTLQPVLGANVYAILMATNIVGNIFFRAITTQPVTLTMPGKK